MPIIGIPRLLLTLLSLAILVGGVGLLLDWREGELVRDFATGDLVRVREDWELWTGLAMLAWSFGGRFVMRLLLARPDRERRSKAERLGGRTIETPQGSELYVEEHGRPDAQTLIFTHGWGMDSTFWRYAREDLADRFRIVTWDLPGLGRSKPATDDAIELATFAADLEHLVDAVGGRKPVLVGHSIGGMTIQTLLRDRPQVQNRIAGVVLLNTTFTNPLRTMVGSKLWLALQKPVLEPMSKLTAVLSPLVWLSQWQSYLSGSTHASMRLGFGPAVTRSELEHVSLLTTRNSPGVQARGNLTMFGWDATGALARAWTPVLVVGGDIDIVTKAEASRVMAAEGGRLEMVGAANHMAPMERAEVYNRLIGEFALEVAQARGGDLGVGVGRGPGGARPGLDGSGPVVWRG